MEIYDYNKMETIEEICKNFHSYSVNIENNSLDNPRLTNCSFFCHLIRFFLNNEKSLII